MRAWILLGAGCVLAFQAGSHGAVPEVGGSWLRLKITGERPAAELRQSKDAGSFLYFEAASPEGFIAKDVQNDEFFFRVGGAAGNARQDLLSWEDGQNDVFSANQVFTSTIDPQAMFLFPSRVLADTNAWSVLTRKTGTEAWTPLRLDGSAFWPEVKEILIRRTSEAFPRSSEWCLMDFMHVPGGGAIPRVITERATANLRNPDEMIPWIAWYIEVLPETIAPWTKAQVEAGKLFDSQRQSIVSFASHRLSSHADSSEGRLMSVIEFSQLRAKGANRPPFFSKPAFQYWAIFLGASLLYMLRERLRGGRSARR